MKTSEFNSANVHGQQSQVFNAWPEKAVSAKRNTKSLVKRSTFSILFEKHALWFEESRFALMTLMITLQSCIGSIACMYILQNNSNDFVLVSCAMVTMASNAMFISQAPAKFCIAFFYLSILVNSVFILINC
jgi:hypothetical protein